MCGPDKDTRTLRHLADSGLVVLRRGRWVMTRRYTRLALRRPDGRRFWTRRRDFFGRPFRPRCLH